jgi:hypothetical protein
MHQDLQRIESGIFGVMRTGGGAQASLEERLERLASCMHDLLRVVSNVLEELDDQRRVPRR